MREVRVMIGVPSMGTWVDDFGVSLCGLMLHTIMNPPEGMKVSLRLCRQRGSLLPKLRQEIVRYAHEYKATHLLFLDSDHEFPPVLLSRWLAFNKSVIAANCVIKQIPSKWTAVRKSKDFLWGEKVFSDPHIHGLEEVWRVGTGLMLINMQVFKEVPKPHFDVRYEDIIGPDGTKGFYVGEDWSFCEKLERAGIPIYIDHTVSHHVTHIGPFTYGPNHIGEFVEETNNAEEGVQGAQKAKGQQGRDDANGTGVGLGGPPTDYNAASLEGASRGG